MKLSPSTRVRLVELPGLPSSLFGRLGSLLGVRADQPFSVADLPAVRELLRGVPASVLVGPEAPQARLPYELVWD
jgi:hypothetical protein